MMIEQVCAFCRNYFADLHNCHYGAYAVKDGALIVPFPVNADYIRIWSKQSKNCTTFKVTSAEPYEAGLYKVHAEGLRDEEFLGSVWLMFPPPDFIAICEAIEKWQSKYGGIDSPEMSPFQSESWNGTYSYTKKSGSSESGSESGWAEAFKSQLKPYRKVRL